MGGGLQSRRWDDPDGKSRWDRTTLGGTGPGSTGSTAGAGPSLDPVDFGHGVRPEWPNKCNGFQDLVGVPSELGGKGRSAGTVKRNHFMWWFHHSCCGVSCF